MGGSARTWSATLPDSVMPGGQVSLRLVMTKADAPDVRIGFAIRVLAA